MKLAVYIIVLKRILDYPVCGLSVDDRQVADD